MKALRYKVNTSIVLGDLLFLEGDVIYIQENDAVNGRPQQVFLADRTHIGSISSSTYWDLKKQKHIQEVKN